MRAWLQILCNGLLLHASKRGSSWLVRLALCLGADLETKDTNGNTAILKACGGQSYDDRMVIYSRGHEKVLLLLIAHGADINIKNIYGLTPIVKAVSNDWVEGRNILKMRGAELSSSYTGNKHRRADIDYASRIMLDDKKSKL